MPTPLPYLPTYKNVEKLFTNKSTARIPASFTQKFLTESLGLKSIGDRPLIPFLRYLGFIDGSNTPTNSYSELKNPELKGKAIATAIKHAYAPLFDADEKANERSNDALRGLVSQVSGGDANTISKIMGTLNGLLKLADFTESRYEAEISEEDEPVEENNDTQEAQVNKHFTKPKKPSVLGNPFTPPFNFNIQVHLPSNGTEEVYMNIFNAIRKVFN